MEGMEGEELRATTDLRKIGFASKRRLVRAASIPPIPTGGHHDSSR